MKKTTITEKFDADGKLVERITTTEMNELTTQPCQWPVTTYPIPFVPIYEPLKFTWHSPSEVTCINVGTSQVQ